MKNQIKNIAILFLLLLSFKSLNGQTKVINSKLKVTVVDQGVISDSILVRGSDQILKYVKKSDLLAAYTKSVDLSAANTSLDDTNLSVVSANNLQDFAQGIDNAVLKDRGTGVSVSYTSSVVSGGTTFSQGLFVGEINGDQGYFPINYPGSTGVSVSNLLAPSTYVYINNSGNLEQQVTEPTRQDWGRKIFTMRIAVDTVSQTILGFEYLSNPIGHYSNSIRDLYSFLLAQGVPFKKDQIVTGRASDLGFDVSAGSFLEFGGTGDINNANTPNINSVSNAPFFLSTRTGFDSGGNTNLPKFWDNNGTLTALGSTTLVAHRLYRFSNGNLCLQYGQGNYANMALAKVGARLEEYVLNPALKNATFFGWWFIESTATNTGGTTLTDFVEYTLGTQGGSSNVLSGALLKGNNLSDLLDAATARTNLGVTALDAQNVKLTGNQSIAGQKEFVGIVKMTNKLDLSDVLGNSFIGVNSGSNNTTGTSNVSLGDSSLFSNTEGFNNLALSFQSLRSNTIGDYNLGLGYQSLYHNTSGNHNLGLGYLSGSFIANGTTENQTGSKSIFIGQNTRANADGETNQIVIGDTAIGEGSNKVVLGNDSITDTYLKGHIRGNGSATFSSSVSAGGDIISAGTSFIGRAITSSYTPDDGVFGGKITNVGGFKVQTNGQETLTLSASGGNMTVRGEGNFGSSVNATDGNFSGQIAIGTNIGSYGLEVNNGGSNGLKVQSGNSVNDFSLLVSDNLDNSLFSIKGDGASTFASSVSAGSGIISTKPQGSANTQFIWAGNGGWNSYKSDNDGIFAYIGSGAHLSLPVVNDNDFIIRAEEELAINIGSSEKFRIKSSGAATFASTVTNSGFLRVLSTSFSAPSSGVGLEIRNVSGTSSFVSYDRDNSVYKPITIDGSDIKLKQNGNDAFTISNTGAATFASSMGVGVTPKTTSTSWRHLQIGGAGNIIGRSSSLSDAIFANNYYINSSNQDSYITAGGSARMFFNDNVISFEQASSGSADAPITWSTPLTINSNQSATFASSVTAGGNAIQNGSNPGLKVTSTNTSQTVLSLNNSTSRNYELAVGGSASGVGAGSFYIYDGTAASVRFKINSTGSATFGSSVAATRFIGVKNENYVSMGTTRTLLESDYYVHNGLAASVTITIPTGLSTNRSWEFSNITQTMTISASSGVNITVINNQEANNLSIGPKHSAKLVATSIANQFLLIKY